MHQGGRGSSQKVIFDDKGSWRVRQKVIFHDEEGLGLTKIISFPQVLKIILCQGAFYQLRHVMRWAGRQKVIFDDKREEGSAKKGFLMTKWRPEKHDIINAQPLKTKAGYSNRKRVK